MLLTKDDEDGNRLQLEKVGPTFSSSSIVSSKLTLKTIVMVCFSFENSLDIFLLVL